MKTKLAALMLGTSLASPVAADITGEDVLDTYKDLLARLGLDLVVETQRTGDALEVLGGQVQLTYPIIGGEARIDLPPHRYVDQADGTVSIEWQDTYALSFVADIPEVDETVSGTLNLVSAGNSVVASGDPGDITIVTNSDGASFSVSDVSVPDMDGDFTLEGTIGTTVSETRLQGGDLFTMDNALRQGTIDISMNFESPAIGYSNAVVMRYGDSTAETALVLPMGMSILNLSPALRDGLSIRMEAAYASSQYEDRTIDPQLGETNVFQTTGPYRQVSGLDRSGITAEGEGEELAMLIEIPQFIPLPVAIQMQGATFDTQIPLLADDAPQAARFLMGLEGLNIDESLWAMVDANGALPRDPADLLIDIDAGVRIGQDLLDFPTWMAMDASETPDIAFESVTINAVSLAALGAMAEASGAFTFDNDDLQTFPGFPRPDGAATATLTGINALLQTLQGAGLLPPDQAMGAMMGLGMFAVPVGDDVLQSEVEVKDGGQVFVNGVRMR